MSLKGQPKKTFTKEFKQQAVKLSNQNEVTITQLAEELGISISTLTRWRSEDRDSAVAAFPGKGHQTPEQEELTRLRRELARVKQQRDILKKAITFFHEDL